MIIYSIPLFYLESCFITVHHVWVQMAEYLRLFITRKLNSVKSVIVIFFSFKTTGLLIFAYLI